MTDSVAAGEARRLHWSTLIASFGKSLRAMWSALAGGAYFAVSGQWWLVALIVTGLIVAVVVGALLGWLTFTYRVGADEIRIDSGILNRTHRSIPFDRVQDVSISQGPIARLLGVAAARFETGSASDANSEEGVLASVPLDEAEALRRLIRARRSALTPAAVVSVEPAAREAGPEVEPIYAMDFKRLLVSGLFNFSLALIAALAGASLTAGDAIGFDPFKRNFWRRMEDVLGPVASYALEHRVSAAIGGILLLVLIGVASGLTRTLLRDYGFRVDGTKTGLRRRRGLLTKTDVTLQIRRIQAAIVGSGPVRAAFGWHDLKLQSLAQDEGGKNDHLIAPLASAQEVERLLAELGLGSLAGVEGWRKVSPAFVTVLAVGLAPLFALAGIQAIFSPLIGIGIATLLLIAIGLRYASWRRTRYALDSGRVLIRSGWWRRGTSVLPVANIQSIELSETFVSRWFGTASLVLGVAGGSGHVIPALPRESARQLRGELLTSVA
jgi:putative membrane protein